MPNYVPIHCTHKLEPGFKSRGEDALISVKHYCMVVREHKNYFYAIGANALEVNVSRLASNT